MNIITNPNLPGAAARVCAVSAQHPALLRQLHSLNIMTVPVLPRADAGGDIADHADMNLLHLGGRDILLLPNQPRLQRDLTNMGFRVTLLPPEPRCAYPEHACLNAAFVGKRLFCNSKTVSPRVLEFAQENGDTIHHVNQGYTKCAVCVVSENAIITDDDGIAKAAAPYLDTLHIAKGGIRLDGHPYGFIGGTCGLLAPDLLLFYGNVEALPDGKRILDFLAVHGVRALYSKELPLTDAGGILPLAQCEEENT